MKKVEDLSPRDIEHDNPEFRRLEDTVEFLGKIYTRSISMDDTVTVIRFRRSSKGQHPVRQWRAPHPIERVARAGA